MSDDDEVREKVASARALAALLGNFGEIDWAEELEQNATAWQRTGRRTLSRRLEAGGMGSLSDVIIWVKTGTGRDPLAEVWVDAALHALLIDIYEPILESPRRRMNRLKIAASEERKPVLASEACEQCGARWCSRTHLECFVAESAMPAILLAAKASRDLSPIVEAVGLSETRDATKWRTKATAAIAASGLQLLEVYVAVEACPSCSAARLRVEYWSLLEEPPRLARKEYLGKLRR